MENLSAAMANVIRPNQEPNISPFEFPDLLTDDQKESVYQWELKKAKENLFFRLVSKGMLPESAGLAIAQKDWGEEVNRESVIAAANRRAFYLRESEGQYKKMRENEKAKQAALVKEWDARKFFDCIKNHFIVNNGLFRGIDWQKDYIRALCLWMAKDARFEAEMGFSFEKGLMIVGTGGQGKTEMIKALADNPVSPIRVISILGIAKQVKEDGFCNLSLTGKVLIDDVGSEPDSVNYFGTRVNWFKDFIEDVHLSGVNFHNLIITTNLSGEDIEARYGYRVRSRLREMMNVIKLNGKDLRK